MNGKEGKRNVQRILLVSRRHLSLPSLDCREVCADIEIEREVIRPPGPVTGQRIKHIIIMKDKGRMECKCGNRTRNQKVGQGLEDVVSSPSLQEFES